MSTGYGPRYDVELYQRIEQLIGKQLPLYPTAEEEVMALMERVTEVQRLARMVRTAPLHPSEVGSPLLMTHSPSLLFLTCRRCRQLRRRRERGVRRREQGLPARREEKKN